MAVALLDVLSTLSGIPKTIYHRLRSTRRGFRVNGTILIGAIVMINCMTVADFI